MDGGSGGRGVSWYSVSSGGNGSGDNGNSGDCGSGGSGDRCDGASGSFGCVSRGDRVCSGGRVVVVVGVRVSVETIRLLQNLVISNLWKYFAVVFGIFSLNIPFPMSII